MSRNGALAEKQQQQRERQGTDGESGDREGVEVAAKDDFDHTAAELREPLE
jgi:hypothetical protein